MAYKLQHMGLGGILDQAIAICKDHFGLLFKIMLIVLVPFSLLFNLATLLASPEIPANPTPEDMAAIGQSQLFFMPLFLVASLIQTFVVAPLSNAAVIQAVARLYLGEPVTAMDAIRHAFSRLGALIGTNFLMTLAIGVGFMLCLVPGIYFAIWFGLSLHVVVLEKLSGPTAMRRSKKLVHPERGKFLALGIIMFVIALALGGGANFVPQPHLRVILATLVQACTAILIAAGMVVFYFSARCGEENFDLHYLAEAIGEAPPAATDNSL
jgi:hypothetical protein